MALRFMDSFDHYATADLLQKYTSVSGSPTIAAGGRFGTALRLNNAGATQGVIIVLPSQATWIIGVALKFSVFPTADSTGIIILRDSGTIHVDMRITAEHRLQLTRAGTVLGTSTTVLTEDDWYFIELKTTIADAPSGSAVLHINGIEELNLTGIDTRNGVTATANELRLHNNFSATVAEYYFDDLYVCDGTGGAPTNDFLGDCRVEALLPNGNGNSSQFDGSDGNQVDNYLLVDEATPDADTTYVQSPDVGDKDTYAYGNLVTTSGTVFGVQPVPMFRKTDAGSVTAVSVARVAGVEEDSAQKMVLDSYRYSPDIRETKPGGGAWTVADVNGAEFGIKVNS